MTILFRLWVVMIVPEGFCGFLLWVDVEELEETDVVTEVVGKAA